MSPCWQGRLASALRKGKATERSPNPLVFFYPVTATRPRGEGKKKSKRTKWMILKVVALLPRQFYLEHQESNGGLGEDWMSEDPRY